jgi:phage baseplate assembly protein W
MSELGTDISGTFDGRMRLVSGTANLVAALVRRLQTPRGGLFYAPDYGTDLRAWLNESFTSQRIFTLRAAVVAECEKDPRVESVLCRATYDSAAELLTVEIQGTAADGPFELVLAVTALSVEVLS